MNDLPRLSDLTRPFLDGKLSAAGVSPAAVAAKLEMFDACRKRLLEQGCPPDAPALALAVPGRIEVLGKHTDYAGGRSLLAATEKGFCLLAARRPAGPVRIAPVSGEPIEFAMSPDLQPPLGHWSNYPMTVARRVSRNFAGPFAGADIAFASDLPPAAGMSSSSAMVVAIFLALSRLNDLPARDEYRAIRSTYDLCGYLGCIENGQSFGTLTGDKGVGTFGGSEDHTAILCCKPGTLSQFHYCPVVFERDLPLPKDLTFVIADSGVIAEKTGAALQFYNRASQLAREAAQAWRSATGGSEPNLEAIAISSPDAAPRMRKILEGDGPLLLNRFNQFYAESREIIPAAGDALHKGDLAAFGQLVRQSQALAEGLLGNQVPETIFLAKSAREAGAVAASAFGAGFGGAVWALAHQAGVQAFCEKWTRLYHEQFPGRASASRFVCTRPGPGVLDLTR